MMVSRWLLQDDQFDDVVRQAYQAVFFLAYYNREGTNEYKRFHTYVKRDSLERFGFVYTEEEEVRRGDESRHEREVAYTW